MGEIIEFPSNGSTAQGYLALPDSGVGVTLVVIQEWWGLVPHIIDVCDRFAAEGFVALAPDPYRGDTTTEPDEAGKLMRSEEHTSELQSLTRTSYAVLCMTKKT